MKTFIAIGLFAFLIYILSHGLGRDPTRVPSPLVGHSAPAFELPLLFNSQSFTKNDDFKGHVTLLNIWASWCGICAREHELLMRVAQNASFELIGLNYKDDRNNAKRWLADKGNPYKRVAFDENGLTAMDWGVYGTPETYIIDKHGKIQFKYIGAITPEDWDQTLLPLINVLEKQQ